MADLNKIHMARSHLLKLVKAVLDLPKIEAGKGAVRIIKAAKAKAVAELE